MSRNLLHGTWRIAMRHLQVEEIIYATLYYEPVLEGAFTRLTWIYEHPDFPDAMAIFDDTSYHYFDVRGYIRIFDIEFTDAGWSMQHLDADFSQKFAAAFTDDDSFEMRGFYSSDLGSTWLDDFSLTGSRQQDAAN